MEAAVVGIGIFALAVSAQRERRHRGVGPVVGRVPEQRQARAAVGAGGEGVAVAAREGVQRFCDAGCAAGPVRRNAQARLCAAAASDLEGRRRLGRQRHVVGLPLVYAQAPARHAEQARFEVTQRRRRSKNLNARRRAEIAHPAREAQLTRQPQHLRPQAHALHDAAQINAPAFDQVGQHRAHVNTSHNSTRLLPESTTTQVSPCMASA